MKKVEKNKSQMTEYLQNIYLIRDLYPQLLQLNSCKNSYNSTVKTTQQLKEHQVFKGANNLNGWFPREDTQMTNKHQKRCSTSYSYI